MPPPQKAPKPVYAKRELIDAVMAQVKIGVAELLAKGDTCDAIGLVLVHAGCKGWTRSAAACPLSLYLNRLVQKVDTRANVLCGIWSMSVWIGAENVSDGPIDPRLGAFAHAYDIGTFPGLMSPR